METERERRRQIAVTSSIACGGRARGGECHIFTISKI